MAATGTGTTRRLDALVVGAGFGGIYMLHKLRNDLGLDAVAIDKAGGVGGTWYWNKYPGALSDSESFVYQYSFDRDLYAQTPWTTKYVRQPEILEYLNGVVDRYDLREHIQLETGNDRRRRSTRSPGPGPCAPTAASPSSAGSSSTVWGCCQPPTSPTSRHGRLRGPPGAHRRVARGPGPDRQARRGHRQRLDRQPGHHRHRPHRRPPDLVPAHPAVQRAGRQPRAEPEPSFGLTGTTSTANWEQVRNSSVAMGFEESTVTTFSVTAEERERIFEARVGRGRRIPVHVRDVLRHRHRRGGQRGSGQASSAARSPRSSRIPETAPQAHAHRPVRPATAVRLRLLRDLQPAQRLAWSNSRRTPITHLTEKGIVTADGTLHELDVLICATGFDAVDGNYRPRRHPAAATARGSESTGGRTHQLPRHGHHAASRTCS